MSPDLDKGSLSLESFFADIKDVISKLPDSDEELLSYIQEEIILPMDKRRGRAIAMSEGEIVRKLMSTLTNKPGEVIETMEARIEAVRTGMIIPALALEYADIIYYSQQPNCPIYLQDPCPFIYSLGEISMRQAYLFCIIKYTTRLNYGDEDNYKEIEARVMREFLHEIMGRSLVLDLEPEPSFQHGPLAAEALRQWEEEFLT